MSWTARRAPVWWVLAVRQFSVTEVWLPNLQNLTTLWQGCSYSASGAKNMRTRGQ